MEAKDLMIGDLVRVNRDVCIKNDTIVRVCGIDATNRLVEKGLEGSATCVPVDDFDFYSGGIWVKYLSPIPLTPEILEKNGFTYSASESNGLCRTYIYGANSNHVLAEVTLYDLPINGCNCLIRIETDSQTCEGINKIHNCDLLYVHQLQHALRLCQIEKEIVL